MVIVKKADPPNVIAAIFAIFLKYQFLRRAFDGKMFAK